MSYFDLWQGQELFFFSKYSRRYLGPTQSPIESLLEAFLPEKGGRGVKHSPSVVRLIMRKAVTSIETGGGHL
jgi:hypothetical protein